MPAIARMARSYRVFHRTYRLTMGIALRHPAGASGAPVDNCPYSPSSLNDG